MRKARQEGQIPKSQELVQWTSLLATVFLLRITIQLANDRFQPLLRQTSNAIERAEIDRLGSLLAFVNILAVPLLVAGFGVVFGLIRRNKAKPGRAKRGAA